MRIRVQQFLQHQPDRDRNWRAWLVKTEEREAWRLDGVDRNHASLSIDDLDWVAPAEWDVPNRDRTAIRMRLRDALEAFSRLPERSRRTPNHCERRRRRCVECKCARRCRHLHAPHGHERNPAHCRESLTQLQLGHCGLARLNAFRWSHFGAERLERLSTAHGRVVAYAGCRARRCAVALRDKAVGFLGRPLLRLPPSERSATHGAQLLAALP
jgi:hypothetical protein